MRKLVLQMQTSVDGFVSRTDGSLDWLIWDFSDNWPWDVKLKNEFNEIIRSVDCILLSGNMAGEGYMDHWTAMSIKHAKDPLFAFTQQIVSIQKIIFSKTISQPKWDNAILARSSLEAEIAAIKAKPGKDLIAFGGASFASALLEASVVDELQLFVNPRILGDGISIFTNAAEILLQLISAQTFDCGISVLRYSINNRSKL